jgi:hypothetical protein
MLQKRFRIGHTDLFVAHKPDAVAVKFAYRMKSDLVTPVCGFAPQRSQNAALVEFGAGRVRRLVADSCRREQEPQGTGVAVAPGTGQGVATT